MLSCVFKELSFCSNGITVPVVCIYKFLNVTSHIHTLTPMHTHTHTHSHTHTQSPQPTASDDDSDGWYSAPEEQEELVEHYPCTSLSPQTVPGSHTRSLASPSPPTRPGGLTSTDESGSLCPVESLVGLEPQEPGKSETGEGEHSVSLPIVTIQ